MTMKMKRPRHLHLFRDRHGKPRAYYRRPGKPAVPLPLPPYSEAFWIAYRAAEAQADAPVVAEMKPKAGSARPEGGAIAGSMSALIEAYYRSAEWRSLSNSSRETYRRQLDHFRAEHGHRLVADLKTHHINQLMDRMADRPAAANNLRDRLSTLMKYAMASGWREDNPVLFAKKVRHKTRGFRTWTEDDIAAFRKHWPVGSPQRLAFEILLFTGLRRSDAVRLGPQHLKDGYHVIATKKSGDLVTLEIPLHPTLARHLAYAPEGLVYIQTRGGHSRSVAAFTSWIKEAAERAGLPSNSSPHGLRKTACRRLAEAGCSGPQIQAITGHQNLAEVDTYIREVNRKALAQGAMATITDAFDEAEP